MENLIRYGLETDGCYCECGCGAKLTASPSGEWVKFSDIKELLQTSHNEELKKIFLNKNNSI